MLQYITNLWARGRAIINHLLLQKIRRGNSPHNSPHNSPPPAAAPDKPLDLLPINSPLNSPPLSNPVVISQPEIDLGLNRHARRVYERRRRKHDKFVTPKGELPKRQPRPKPEAELEPEIKAELEAVLPSTSAPTEVLNSLSFIAHRDMNVFIAGQLVDSDEDVLFEEAEFYGEYTFRDTILDQLDKYFYYIERMRKFDRETFDLYSQIGAYILPHAATSTLDRRLDRPLQWNRDPVECRQEFNMAMKNGIPPWFVQEKPSFGCFAYGTDTATERYEKDQTEKAQKEHKKAKVYVPRFMHFRKYESLPSFVQPIGVEGAIYIVTVYWDSAQYRENTKGVVYDFPLYISNDGKRIHALKTFDERTLRFKRGRGKRRHLYPEDRAVQVRQWGYPEHLKEWAADYHQSPNDLVTELFVSTINHWERVNASVCKVLVSKGSLTASFSINPRRLAYFFRDRDIELTDRGARKRVFHIVKPHSVNGRYVPMHFRGEKKFTWAGYNVEILVPGINIDPSTFNAGIVEDTGEGGVTMKQLGTFMAKTMRR
jgi:hypothetical protein